MSGPPAWTEVSVEVPTPWQELVAEVLSAGLPGAEGAGAQLGGEDLPAGRGRVRCYLPPGEDGPAARDEIRRRLGELASRTLAPELAGLTPIFRALPAEDWATSWQGSWRPFRVGPFCVVRPGDEPPLRAGDLRLELDPGGVFGSGRHTTTRHALRALARGLSPGERLLDVGTGSGILAVAAALLGAGAVLGFDLDADSPPAARALAEVNAVGRRCEFRCGGFELIEDLQEPFDALLVNIHFQRCRGQLARLGAGLRPGGWFALAGCPAAEAVLARAELVAAGLEPAQTWTDARWTCFVGSRVG